MSENSDSVSSSSDDDSMSVEEGFEWSAGMSSLRWFNLIPKDGDYTKYKEQLQNDLRVGSCYHLGTREVPFSSWNNLSENGTTKENQCKRTMDGASSCAFLRHPLCLVSAREQGSIGPSSKSKRLVYKATRWRVAGHARPDGLQCYGNRAKGAFHTDPQTFEESISGSLWAVSRLHLADKIKCHRGCVNTLCFNTSGNWIASGSDDLKVAVTDWNTKRQVIRYNTGHCMNIFHVKFLPETNDLKLVSCACDSEVRLAELSPDGSLASGSTRLLVSHNQSCHKLALPAGEPYTVLSAGADGQVFSIDIRTAKATNILWLPFSEFFSVACNPSRPQEIALCGRSESIIRIYDRRKMTERDPKSGYLHCFGADHLRSSNRRSPSLDLQVDLLDDSADERVSARDHSNSENEGEDSSDFLSSLSAQLGRRVRDVLSGLRDRAEVAFRFRDRSSAASHPSYKLESSRYSVTSAVYTNQGDAILASYNDDDIYLFDTRHPVRPFLHRYSGHRNMQTIVSAAFFGPNSEYVVSGSDDGFFYIWDRESEGIVQWLHADADGAVNVVESHPSLPILATAGLDYDFKIWAPVRSILNSDDPSYGSHLKYTFGAVPPSVRRLRQSRLSKALFADPEPPVSCTPAIATPTADSSAHSSVADLSPTRATSATTVMSPAPVRKRRRRRSSSSSCASLDCYAVDQSESLNEDNEPTVANASTAQPTRSGKRYRRHTSNNSQAVGSNSASPSQLTVEPSVRVPNSSSTVARPLPPMPFSVQDLQLRVAQNWLNRTCERAELEGLEEADPRIVSAIESVTQFHGRIPLARRNETTDSDTTSDDSMMSSFVLLRRSNCPTDTVNRSSEDSSPISHLSPSSTSSSSTTFSSSTTHSCDPKARETSDDSRSCHASSEPTSIALDAEHESGSSSTLSSTSIAEREVAVPSTSKQKLSSPAQDQCQPDLYE